MWDLLWRAAKHDKKWGGLVVLWCAVTIADAAQRQWREVPEDSLVVILTLLVMVTDYLLHISRMYIKTLEAKPENKE